MKDIITVDQLNFNFLGKIFGKKGVRLTDQGLLIDTKKEPTELISFAEVKRFAYIEEGFFGATRAFPKKCVTAYNPITGE